MGRIYKNGINYELLGTIYLAGQEYQKAYTTFEEVLKFDTSSAVKALEPLNIPRISVTLDVSKFDTSSAVNAFI